MSLDDFVRQPPSFSHLLTATLSSQPLFTSEFFLRCEQDEKWVLDLAQPYDVDPQVRHHPNVTLLNLDDLASFESSSSAPHMEYRKQIEACISEQLASYYHRYKMIPLLKGLSELTPVYQRELLDAHPKEHNKLSQAPESWAEGLARRQVYQAQKHLEHILKDAFQQERSPGWVG